MECINGNTHWYLDGVLHREDGPASVWSNGDKVWYKHGIIHRDNGPAVECGSGDQHWYINGVWQSSYLHRWDLTFGP